ncbi:T9SS C-terminal target domain-containing protein [Bacteroidetes/Chlorobi group bacterium ChocPot_Mid]|nr:MAG: T9SS C-terminal target domain-containing protein [Bacteroidetes/Chlorobi group bacterium ChocPot_Mid]
MISYSKSENNISDLSEGIYFLKISFPNKPIIRKFIVQR